MLSGCTGDIFSVLPEQGARVELYVHQDERGETEYVECRPMPQFDHQGGYSPYLSRHYETEGRKFYRDAAKTNRRHQLAAIACLLGFLIFWWSHLTLLVLMFHFLVNGLHWRQNKKQPESRNNWLFTLNQKGLVFNPVFIGGQLPSGRLYFSAIQSVSLEPSKILARPYWRIAYQNPRLRTIKVPLSALGDQEREQANELLKHHLADYPQVSVSL